MNRCGCKYIRLLMAMILAMTMFIAYAAADQEVLSIEEVQVFPTVTGKTNNEAVEMFFERAVHGPVQLRGATGRSKLGTWGGRLYDQLKTKINSVANGTESSTEFSILLKDVFDENRDTYTFEEMGVEGKPLPVGWFSKMVEFSTVLDALLVDCPWDLYWYDKTSQTGIRMTLGYYPLDNGIQFDDYFNTAALTVSMPVANVYRKNNNAFCFDTSFGQAAIAAANTAKGIKDKYVNKTDREKLIAYRDEICKLTDYNHPAAQNSNTLYGNPWQMIWVFDGNADTKVVCEGYSKAFQFLCDESSFQSARSIIVNGMMVGTDESGGPHMWNIVTLDNKNYLADVTNSDNEQGGDPYDGLFLVQSTDIGTINFQQIYGNGNVVNVTYNSQKYSDMQYGYDPDIVKLYGESQLDTMQSPISGDFESNLSWVLTPFGTLTISGTGEMDNFSDSNPPPWQNYKAVVRKVIINEGVISIGSAAFAQCTNLEEVTIPAGITVIGNNAFNGTILKSVAYGGSSIQLTKIIGTNNDEISQAENITCALQDATAFVINEGDQELTRGQTKQLTVTSTNPSAEAVCEPVWTSDSETVATVDNTGVVTAVAPGTATITATYNEYDASITVTVEPDKVILVPKAIANLIYNGTVQTGVEAGTGYTLTGATATAAGTYTATATLEGDYTWSDGTTDAKTIEWSIASKSITDQSVSISLDSASFTYNGVAQTPTVTVKDGSDTLTATTDYMLSYQKKTEEDAWTGFIGKIKDAGTYRVVVSGKGNYKDSCEQDFIINKAELTVTQQPQAKDLTYTGTAQELITAGSVEGGTLEYSLDNSTWSVTVPSGTDAKTYDVWWRVTGDENHNDVSSTKIDPSPEIKKIALTVAANNQTITYGDTIKQMDCSVTGNVINGHSLDIILSTNEENTQIIPSVTISANGTDVTENYNIQTVNGTLTVNNAILTVIPTGGQTKVYGEIDPTFAYTVSGLVYDDNESVITGELARASGEDARGYEISIGTLSATNYDITVISGVMFIIEPKPITGATVLLNKPESLIYDGNPKEVSVASVTLDGKVLLEGTDYSVSDDNLTGTERGTYTVTVTGHGNYTGSTSIDWAITDKPMTVSALDVNMTYDGQSHGITVNVTVPENGWTVKYGKTGGNYDLDASPTITDAGKLTVYYKVTADDYADYTGFATVSISKANASITSAPAPIANLIANGQAQTLVTAGSANGGTMQYAIGTNATTAPSSGWDTELPTGTNVGTYYVWYKAVGKPHYNDTASFCVQASIAVNQEEEDRKAADAKAAADKAAFADEKTTQKTAADALAVNGDSAVCQQLIQAAKAQIDALTYNESKELKDNKAAIAAIVTKLSNDLATQRAAEKAAADKAAADKAAAEKAAAEKTAAEKAAAEKAEADKTAAGTVTTYLRSLSSASSKASVAETRAMYNALIEDQKQLVAGDDLVKLENAEKAVEVTVAIEQLTSSSTKADVEAARAKYNALSDEQKQYVSADTVTALTNAEKAVEEAANKPVTGAFNDSTGSYTITENKTAIYEKPAKVESKITVPDTVEVPTVGGGTITVPVTEIKEKAFSSAKKKLTQLTIGNNVEIIGKSACEKCEKLTTVKGGAAVKEIRDKAFASCTKLKKLPTFNNLVKIGKSAFAKAKALTKFVFGEFVSNIGSKAFYECEKLKTLTFKGTVKLSVASKAFDKIASNAKATIKKAVKKDYTKALKKGKLKESQIKAK